MNYANAVGGQMVVFVETLYDTFELAQLDEATLPRSPSYPDTTMNLIMGGARIHQSGCLGCIGMGQAPGTGAVSLRTFPRNFPGRSGTFPDNIYLCSPETAVASAIFGKVTDPRKLGEYPKVSNPAKYVINDENLVTPPEDSSAVEIMISVASPA